MSYEVFEELCKENEITVYKVAKGTELPTSLFSNWKAGKYTPKADKRKKIADFFGVSLEYLDTGDSAARNITKEIQNAESLDPQIKELFSLAKKATPEQRAQAVRIFHALIGDDNG